MIWFHKIIQAQPVFLFDRQIGNDKWHFHFNDDTFEQKHISEGSTCFLHERDALLFALIVDSGAGHLSEQLQTLRVRRCCHLIDLFSSFRE